MSTPAVNEKVDSTNTLPTYVEGQAFQAKQPKAHPYKKLFTYVLSCFAIGYFVHNQLDGKFVKQDAAVSASALCAQSEVLTPSAKLTDVYANKAKIIDWLSGAVQVPTENFDVMANDINDPRWKAFLPFHDYLESAFPLIHKTLTLEKVNTYGLLYTWEGSDASKKPLLLTAHQDVVPVEPSTVSAWTFPPYSGYYDNSTDLVWGRGSADDKSVLISAMSAVEFLIESGYKPKRTIIMSWGFDEESGGKQGATALGKYLEQKLGKDSIYMLVDEGNGIDEQYGTYFAQPAVAEKGYLDVQITVETPGGHSSVPPDHTGIGMLAEAITELEGHQNPSLLTRKNVIFEAFQCYSKYGTGVPKDLTKLVAKAATSDSALKKFVSYLIDLSPMWKAAVHTTRGVDLINGGIKVNALPETAYAVANHRISADSSVSALQELMTETLQPLSEKYQLNFNAFQKTIATFANARGTLKLEVAFNSALEPAPISPHDPSDDIFNVFAGSVKSTWSTRRAEGPREIVMAPALAIGNTDTKRYWNLTRNIYRFGYSRQRGRDNGVHTVDERSVAEDIVEHVRFIQTLIFNANESD